MTRGEQIDWLCRLRCELEITPAPKEWKDNCKQALSEVIKALEQEPCEDMERKIEKEYLFESLCEDLKKLQAENEKLRNALEQEPTESQESEG